MTSKSPYGDVQYADPGFQKDGVQRFPIDNPQHIRAAWDYIHHSEDRAKYTPENIAHIESAIVTAWKHLIDRGGPPDAEHMSEDMKNVGIFASGKWKSASGKVVEVTDAMLDEMIASFNDLGNKVAGFRPPLKLGHGEAQAFIGQAEGAPAMGWVQALRREGSKLFADLSNVPSALIDLIRRRHYNSVSVEIMPTVEHDGATFKNVLCGVAILGSEWPAVKGLPELSAALFASGADKLALTEVDDQMANEALKFSQEQHNTLVEAAVAQAKITFATEHKAQVATLTTELTSAQERATTAEAKLQTFKADSSTREVTALVDAAITAGTVLPAEKDEMVQFGISTMASGVIKLADGKEKQPIDIFKGMLAKRKGAVNFSEKGRGNGAESDKKADNEVVTRAKAKMAADPQGKLTFADAVQAVTAEDPALKLAWLNEV